MATTACTNCGAALEAGKAFCASCGTPVAVGGQEPVAANVGASPPSATPAAAPSAIPSATAAAEMPAQPSAAVAQSPASPASAGSSTPPLLSVPAPGTLAAPKPSGGGKGKTGLVVGSVVALVAAFAGFKFFTSGPEPGPGPGPDPVPTVDPQPDPDPVPTVDPQPDPDPEPDPNPDPPPDVSEALLELIATNVGPFTLDQVSEFPQGIEAGASAAYQMHYVGPSNVFHILAAYSSPQGAGDQTMGFANRLVENAGYQVLDEGTVDIQGETVGVFVYLSDGESHTIAWSNGILQAIANAGSQSAVFDFWNQLTY